MKAVFFSPLFRAGETEFRKAQLTAAVGEKRSFVSDFNPLPCFEHTPTSVFIISHTTMTFSFHTAFASYGGSQDGLVKNCFQWAVAVG